MLQHLRNCYVVSGKFKKISSGQQADYADNLYQHLMALHDDVSYQYTQLV